MQFPKDHYTHDTLTEWWYYWGKLPSDTFFHYAHFRFKMGGLRTRATHFSTHNGESKYHEELQDDHEQVKWASGYIVNKDGGNFYFTTPELAVTATPTIRPVIHPNMKRNYYVIPKMEGKCRVGSRMLQDPINVWFEHEFGIASPEEKWDYVSAVMNNGMCLTAIEHSKGKYGAVMWDKNYQNSDFIIDGKHFFIHSFGMYLTLEPRVREKIFYPKFGIPYSEQPFDVISKGEKIGYGLRERTYPNTTES